MTWRTRIGPLHTTKRITVTGTAASRFGEGTSTRAYDSVGAIHAWVIDARERARTHLAMPNCAGGVNRYGAYRVKPWASIGGESSLCPFA